MIDAAMTRITADAVKAGLNYREFFAAHLKRLTARGNGQAMGLCPFHEDHEPSFSVNLRTGLFKCLACGESGMSSTSIRR